MIRWFQASIILFSLLVSPAISFAGGPEEDLRHFEERIDALKKMGVPGDERALKYLALELFYNVADRPVLLDSMEKLRIDEFSLTPLVANDVEAIQILEREFPEWKRLRDKRPLTMRSLRITGHSSLFLWDPEQPDVRFIFKLRSDKESRAISAQLTNDTWINLESDRYRGVSSVDYASEFGLGKSGVMRKLSTARSEPGDLILPLHGWLGSPLFTEMASAKGLSRAEYLTTVIANFADLYFSLAFVQGMWMQSHTQNLWIVVKPDGSVHLAAKDFEVTLRHYLMRNAEGIRRMTRQEDLAEFATFGRILKANGQHRSNESARLSEPSFFFAEFPMQTVFPAGNFSFQEKARMLKTFIDRIRADVQIHFGKDIRFSAKLAEVFENLEHYTGDYDLLQFTVDRGTGIGENGRGLFAFSERLMREIHDQVVETIIGPRTYLRGNDEQKELARLFRQKEGFHLTELKPASHISLRPYIESHDSKLVIAKKRLSVGWYNLLRQTKAKLREKLREETIHYEYSENYILKVNDRGELLAAVPSKRAWIEEQRRDAAMTRAMLKRPTCRALFASP